MSSISTTNLGELVAPSVANWMVWQRAIGAEDLDISPVKKPVSWLGLPQGCQGEPCLERGIYWGPSFKLCKLLLNFFIILTSLTSSYYDSWWVIILIFIVKILKLFPLEVELVSTKWPLCKSMIAGNCPHQKESTVMHYIAVWVTTLNIFSQKVNFPAIYLCGW